MTATEHGDQELIDDFILPDDHLADFLPHLLIGFGQTGDRLFLGCGRCHFGRIIVTLCVGVRHSKRGELTGMLKAADSESALKRLHDPIASEEKQNERREVSDL